MVDGSKIVEGTAKVSDGARVFTDVTVFVTKVISACTTWIGELTWWEMLLIVVFFLLILLYFYIKNLASTKIVRRRFVRMK